MIRKKKGKIEWLEFELLASRQDVIHAVFLRHGGRSQGEFASFNLNRKGEDLPEHALFHREQIKEVLQIDAVFSPHQVHGTSIQILNPMQSEYVDCDGLMTNKVGYGLLALHADCQAALFYDPVHKVAASVHAGWRGQVANIYQKTIDTMAYHFHTQTKDLLVCISPSLGPLNSEFKNYSSELPKSFLPFQIKPTYFDLWAIARHQLESAGVLPHHIEIANIDTYAHPEDFYSYRREKAQGKQTGTHGTVIAIKK